MIDEDGEDRGVESSRIHVTLRSTDDPRAVLGSASYMAEDMARFTGIDTPHVSLELPLPPDVINTLVEELEAGRAISVRLSASVDIYRNEVERALAEPWHRQDYYIEEKGWSAAFFTDLRIEGAPALPAAVAQEMDTGWDEEEHLAGPTGAASPTLAINPQIFEPLTRQIRQLKWLAAFACVLAVLAGMS